MSQAKAEGASVRGACAALEVMLRDHEAVRLMEICGTHTVSLFRTGLRSLLPAKIKLISGPGCPVCVTPSSYIDHACALALRPQTVVCTYGDMVRVPGSGDSLAHSRAKGGQVMVVYSAMDALALARENPGLEVVFLAVGFETSAPATALTLLQAQRQGVGNFSVLLGHKVVVPALRALLGLGRSGIDAFICPGHVSVIIGLEAYGEIVRDFGRSCVVAGFEPRSMVEAITRLVQAVLRGEAVLENAYGVAVRAEGNRRALAVLEQVFVPATVGWRALGSIPESGLALAESYADFDAMRRFALPVIADVEAPGCRCGEVIQGLIEPPACPRFGRPCTPGTPIGPCMVSSEGTCAAWYKYGVAHGADGAGR